MCGVVEGAIIKSEPGTTNLCLPIAEPCGPLQTLTLNTVPHPPSSLGSVHHNSNMATAISTLCLPSGQPLTDATLLLQHPSPGPSPPTISIQEGPVDGAPTPYISVHQIPLQCQPQTQEHPIPLFPTRSTLLYPTTILFPYQHYFPYTLFPPPHCFPTMSLRTRDPLSCPSLKLQILF